MVTTMRVNFHPGYEAWMNQFNTRNRGHWRTTRRGSDKFKPLPPFPSTPVDNHTDECDEEACPFGLLFASFVQVNEVEEELPF